MIAQAIGKPIPVEGFKKVKKQFIVDFPFLKSSHGLAQLPYRIVSVNEGEDC